MGRDEREQPLYQLDDAIENALIISEGELTPEIEAMIEERDDKARWLENATKKLMNEHAKVFATKIERDRLNELLKEREALIERLKTTIAKLLGDGQKADLGFAKLSWRASESVAITDTAINSLPDEFVVASFAPDKKAIKEALKSGVELIGCELVKKSNLQIK